MAAAAQQAVLPRPRVPAAAGGGGRRRGGAALAVAAAGRRRCPARRGRRASRRSRSRCCRSRRSSRTSRRSAQTPQPAERQRARPAAPVLRRPLRLGGADRRRWRAPTASLPPDEQRARGDRDLELRRGGRAALPRPALRAAAGGEPAQQLLLLGTRPRRRSTWRSSSAWTRTRCATPGRSIEVAGRFQLALRDALRAALADPRLPRAEAAAGGGLAPRPALHLRVRSISPGRAGRSRPEARHILFV